MERSCPLKVEVRGERSGGLERRSLCKLKYFFEGEAARDLAKEDHRLGLQRRSQDNVV